MTKMEEKLNVLVIDDESQALELLEVILSDEFNVIKARNGQEAFKILNTLPVHIILCDQRMPLMTGDEILARAKVLYPDTVRIMISAYSNIPAVVRAVNEGGIFGYISKPWNPDDLRLFISRAAKFYRLNAENKKLLEELKRISSNLDEIVRNKTIEIENEKQKLKELSITDELTGLCNLRYLKIRWQQEYDRFLRYSQPFSIIMGDIDNFKSINDKYGHLVGDKVLENIARILKESVRKVDVVGRYGGEEFCIITPNTREEGALILSDRIRSKIEGFNFKEGNIKNKITISFGISSVTKENIVPLDELIRRADEALYYVKKIGKNKSISWWQFKKHLESKPQTTFFLKEDKTII